VNVIIVSSLKVNAKWKWASVSNQKPIIDLSQLFAFLDFYTQFQSNTLSYLYIYAQQVKGHIFKELITFFLAPFGKLYRHSPDGVTCFA